jgi:hypothetical protein
MSIAGCHAPRTGDQAAATWHQSKQSFDEPFIVRQAFPLAGTSHISRGNHTVIASRIIRLFAVAIFFAMAAGFVAQGAVQAHENREIGDEGQFHAVVGFLTEPAIQGEFNAISFRLSHNDAEATPNADGQVERESVTGAAASLTFEIIYEDQTAELPVSERWNDPGHYVAYVIPTEPGVYSFRISGEIDGVAFEEIFTAGPDTFDEVRPRGDLEFPAAS